jgi:LemA protein
MERDGIVNPRQAALLRDSLGGRPNTADPPTAGASPISGAIPIGLTLVIVVLLMAVVLGGTDDGSQVQDVAKTLNQAGEYGQMNKSVSAALAAATLLIVPLLLWVWLHNSLVAREERVFEAWAQTESNFQRRADLVPALVETVSRYLRHEAETLTGITEARSRSLEDMAASIDSLTDAGQAAQELLRERGRAVIEEEQALRELYEALARIGRSMTALVAVAEDYPELRSSDQFLELQAQLEGTENRINVARMRFNKAVRDYNRATRQLPGVLVARAGGFKRKAYFQSAEEARNAPELALD